MKYKQLIGILDRANISPEKAAAELGVSGMTLRRWRSKPSSAELPDIYRRAFEPLLKRLLGEGRLHPEDADVAAGLAAPEESFQSVLTAVGITAQTLEQADKSSNAVVVGLARIGEDQNRQEQVKKSSKMLERFSAMSAEWKDRVSVLRDAVRSDELTLMDKLVAFGALFYLITPFDIIPDAIPVFGLVDDFIVLGIAVLYYRARFPHLFAKTRKKP